MLPVRVVCGGAGLNIMNYDYDVLCFVLGNVFIADTCRIVLITYTINDKRTHYTVKATDLNRACAIFGYLNEFLNLIIR